MPSVRRGIAVILFFLRYVIPLFITAALWLSLRETIQQLLG
jgi:hypothetical protein